MWCFLARNKTAEATNDDNDDDYDVRSECTQDDTPDGVV